MSMIQIVCQDRRTAKQRRHSRRDQDLMVNPHTTEPSTSRRRYVRPIVAHPRRKHNQSSRQTHPLHRFFTATGQNPSVHRQEPSIPMEPVSRGVTRPWTASPPSRGQLYNNDMADGRSSLTTATIHIPGTRMQEDLHANLSPSRSMACDLTVTAHTITRTTCKPPPNSRSHLRDTRTRNTDPPPERPGLCNHQAKASRCTYSKCTGTNHTRPRSPPTGRSTTSTATARIVPARPGPPHGQALRRRSGRRQIPRHKEQRLD